jgi:2'-5' RNA ligase
MVRAFIALELSQEIKDNLSSAQSTIRDCNAHLTFVNPENMHITLKFLGDVHQEHLKKVMDVLRSVPFSPFLIQAQTVTVNNQKRPHTVWCDIDDGGMGERLFCLIENALAPLGFDQETRRFTPHATLARVKSMDPSLFSAISSLKEKSWGSCIISGIKLKKSTLLPKGPVYEDLLEVKW